jgi:DinB superfamily
MVERAILSAADQITRKSPRPFPLWKRVHAPLWLASVRLVRLKSPIPVDPALLNAKQELLGELRLTRERSSAFLAATEKRDLSAYCWRHPFLGRLNTYEWFKLIAAHQLRHTKQMKELSGSFQKW